MLHYKELESKVGFLIHLGMTFDSFVPFLNSWRQQRHENGWKLSNKQWFNYLAQQVEDGNLTKAEMEAGTETEEAPLKVKAALDFVMQSKLCQNSRTWKRLDLHVVNVQHVLYSTVQCSKCTV